jgi:hypothetical protein
MDLLWPDADSDAASNSLGPALSSLRRLLAGPDLPPGAALITDRTSVRLNPEAVSTDLAEFEAALHCAAAGRDGEQREGLQQAMSLHRGEYLAGYYESWVLEQRQWLAESYFQALDRHLRLLEAYAVRAFEEGDPASGTRPRPFCKLVHRASTDTQEQQRCQGHDRESAQCGEDMGVASPLPARQTIGANEVAHAVSCHEHTRARHARCEEALLDTQLRKRTRPLGLVGTGLSELSQDAPSTRRDDENRNDCRRNRHVRHLRRR